jgi:hypothetical protein
MKRILILALIAGGLAVYANHATGGDFARSSVRTIAAALRSSWG